MRKNAKYCRPTGWIRENGKSNVKVYYTVIPKCMTFRVLHGRPSAPPYLGLGPSDERGSIRSLPGRRSLRSTDTNRLLVPPVKRSTVDCRSFPVSDPKTWNALPEDVTSSQSEYTFRRQIKTWLFNLFRTSSSDTDSILTFPTLRPFCRLRWPTI